MNHLLLRRLQIAVLLFLCVTLCGKAQAQELQVSVNLKNASLAELFTAIEKQTTYRFAYRDVIIDKKRDVTVDAQNVSVGTVLGKVLPDKNLQYSIVSDKSIVISAKKQTVETANAEQGKLVGIVTDGQGEPIIGANVVEKGTTNGTITDMEGRFSLDVSKNAVLLVSYIGYNSVEAKTAGKGNAVLNITMAEDAMALDDVVVVGYGTQKKVNLTGSIAAVNTKDLENIPTSNLSNTLAGRAPGVTIVNNSGFAGASSSIRVRGSFGEPLYVINNVIRDKTAFDALDPNEVETINILKDAASASIYGSKAGNGVVLVTTKKGTVQKPLFQYKGSYTAASPTRPLQNFSATDELICLNKSAAYQNSILETPDPNFQVPYGQSYFDYFKDKSYNLNDMIWQNPWNQEHNISVNGGNERIVYYMMLGYHGEEGSYENTDYNRYNFRSDITAKITDIFKVNFNISGNERKYSRFYWPYDWDEESMTLSDFYRTTFNGSRLRPWYVDEAGNPSEKRTKYPVAMGGSHFGELVFGDNSEKTTARNVEAILRFDLDLDKFVKGLSTAVAGQYVFADKNRKRFAGHNRSYTFQSGSLDNIFIPGPVDPTKMNLHNLSNTYENIQENVWLDNSYQFNWFLNYNRTFGKHTVSGLLVSEIAGSQSKYLTGRADELLTSSIDQIFVSSNDISRRWFDGHELEDARLSWVGRFNYNFDDRYIAEFSFREDGNAKFGPGRRWGFFPSVSLGWRLSNEKFMKFDWLSNLKIRGSYGTTGDDTDTSVDDGVLVPFGWRNKFKNSDGYMFGSTFAPGIAIGSTPNPFLTWATLEVYDAGVDFGFLNNSLSGEFDFFSKKKTDILQQRVASVPDTYGRDKAAENYAEQSWKGFEFSLRYSGQVRKVNYAVFANLGYVKDKWLKYDEPDNLPAWKSRIGNPNDFIKGHLCDGIIRTQEQLDALPEGFTQFGKKPRLGQLLYRDIRGANEELGADGKVDANDWDYLSRKASPRINYGFGVNLEWNGFSVDALFQGVGAYDRMVKNNNTDGVFQGSPYFDLWTKDVWTPENPDAKYPEAVGEWSEPYGALGSTFWLRDGAYLRLKNLNVAYTLPQQWFRTLGLSKVQVFGNGTNLFCLSGMDEHDPEQEKLDSYPIMKSFTVGLNVNF